MPPASMTPAPLAANSPPSAALRSLSTSLAPETVLGMLEKYLYPVLDTLYSDELSRITNTLSIAHRDRTNAQQRINKIGYEEHKHDGYEEQSEMMSEIAGEILGWLPDLWQIAVEDGLELSLIQKYIDTVDFVYLLETSSPMRILLSLSKPLMGEVEHSADDNEYNDGHWTQAMKDAGFQLHAEYREARIASFKRKPSSLLYNALVAQSPDLQPALLEVTRKHVFSRETPVSRSYADAADIFQKTSETGDLVRLLDVLPRHRIDTAVSTTKSKIVGYLSKQPSEEFRQRALNIIESELREAKGGVVYECERAFPGYEDAFGCLEVGWNRRDKHLSTFVEQACWGLDGEQSNDHDDAMISIDEDDSDYEEEKEG
ncbi:hypothetical protein HETIRDRAFT_120219 [Heterobasidion irregulare TC 32-1]|uniref:Uncharacterized protein n=1 Tax=Heterobasidion irregulare (strain TC 32-1) TaxID=747525 RepID=W4JRF1_HETIT|nr:uncharacterized protein HETIRDRAFT_120219 [Heterobasidion irregulare TC 32-1]ETW75446.1 hypothetical protein HETIRDRAFT_120219 [Heterobasidion irregulare TC 32-1]